MDFRVFKEWSAWKAVSLNTWALFRALAKSANFKLWRRSDAIARLSNHKKNLNSCLGSGSVGLGSGHTVELDVTSFD